MPAIFFYFVFFLCVITSNPRFWSFVLNFAFGRLWSPFRPPCSVCVLWSSPFLSIFFWQIQSDLFRCSDFELLPGRHWPARCPLACDLSRISKAADSLPGWSAARLDRQDRSPRSLAASTTTNYGRYVTDLLEPSRPPFCVRTQFRSVRNAFSRALPPLVYH